MFPVYLVYHQISLLVQWESLVTILVPWYLIGCLWKNLVNIVPFICTVQNLNKYISSFPSGYQLYSLHHHLFYLSLDSIRFAQKNACLFHGIYSFIPFKYLLIKLFYRPNFQHQFISYDHFISCAWVTFVVIDMKAVCYCLAAKKSGHTKCHMYIVCGAVRACGFTIFYFQA